MAKAISDLTASELRQKLERADAAHTAAIKALIGAGRGRETYADTRASAEAGGDKLAETFMAAYAKWAELNNELSWRRRWHGCDRPAPKAK